MHSLINNAKFVRLKPDGTNWELVAGTGDSPVSNSVDTLGFNGVAFLTVCGTISATGTMTTKIQQSTDDAVSDAYADVAGSHNNFVAADTLKCRMTEIFKPQERYLKWAATRATANVVVDALYAVLWNADFMGVTQDANVAGTVTLNTPTEGTA